MTTNELSNLDCFLHWQTWEIYWWGSEAVISICALIKTTILPNRTWELLLSVSLFVTVWCFNVLIHLNRLDWSPRTGWWMQPLSAAVGLLEILGQRSFLLGLVGIILMRAYIHVANLHYCWCSHIWWVCRPAFCLSLPFICHVCVKGCSPRTQKRMQDKLLWCKQMITCLCSVRFGSVSNEMYVICSYSFIMTPCPVGLLSMLSSNTVLSSLSNMLVLKQLYPLYAVSIIGWCYIRAVMTLKLFLSVAHCFGKAPLKLCVLKWVHCQMIEDFFFFFFLQRALWTGFWTFTLKHQRKNKAGKTEMERENLQEAFAFSEDCFH